MEKLISVNEVAKRISAHPDTIRKYEELGYITSIRTLGGHRRYLESVVDQLLHKMKCPVSLETFDSLESRGWFRKERFLYWKRFIGFHYYNQSKDQKEIQKREGSEMVIKALDILSDEDWKSIDKIDETLEGIYSWYKVNHTYYWESAYYFMSDPLRQGTHKVIQDGKDITTQTLASEEEHYRQVLDRLGKIIPTKEEFDNLGCQLDGIGHVLWGMSGISIGAEKSFLAGKGLFPNEREEIERDIKNGVGDFPERRKRLIEEKLSNNSGGKC